MKMRNPISALTVVLLFLTHSTLLSYPKFAALTGEKCQTCHVNPTGGGMRNPYGVKISKEFLYLKFLEKANKTTDINTQITKGITLGGDMRFLFADHQVGEGFPNFNTFFQMQGDLYVNAQVNKYISLMIAPGLYIPNTFSTSPLAAKYEIYGMVSNLPAGLYFKVGRFIPNFGIKIPEHRAYNRIYNDLYTPYASDAGIEVGITPEFGNANLTVTAEISNGSSTNAVFQTNNSFDFDNQRQFTGSMDFRWASKKGNYAFGVGGSFLNNPFKYNPTANINALKEAAGGRVAAGLFKRVSLLGELTYSRLKISDSLSTKLEQRIIFGDIDITVIKGLELKGQYEDFDPKNIPNAYRRRISIGAVIFPLTGLEIESIYRKVQEPNLDTEIKNDEFQTVIKFYF
jgi:hypothetical protein